MRVPTKRFGRTNVQMPVITFGGMRFQQSWKDLPPDEISSAGQNNLEACLNRALECGMYHVETARGYGTSEMQLGRLLPGIDRDKLLVQTKVGVKESAAEFLEAFETSMSYLKLDYVDFLSIHGMNLSEHLQTCLKKGGCLDAIRQLQKEGRVRFCGFSTHAGPSVVVPACQTGEFDYVNLHWYYVYHPIHWSMVEAATEQDMGVFIISPNNKGGMLHDPTEKMTRLCRPLTPMQWHDLYCLARPEVHTLSLGVAKPSDFDEHLDAVTTFWDRRKQVSSEIADRIEDALERALGAEWMKSWHKGLPDYTEIPGQINVKEILRLWTFYKGLDLLEFAKMRYNLLGNAEHWFPGEQATEVDAYDWSCLAASPFAQQIPKILKTCHSQFHVEEEVSRLSESKE